MVNTTDNSFITVINTTESQLENIEINQNFGLDTRPYMELKLQEPKNTVFQITVSDTIKIKACIVESYLC